jgi:hypothetical protein
MDATPSFASLIWGVGFLSNARAKRVALPVMEGRNPPHYPSRPGGTGQTGPTSYVSFPLGHNWLIRQLTKKFATTPAEIMSSLKLYLDSTQHNTVAAKMEKELVAAKDEWLTAFREALTKILDNCILPENVFVLAEPVMVNIFRSWLKEEQFEHLTISNKKFEVKVLKDDVFGSFCVHGDTAIHDFTLMVEAIFCDKITKA